MAPGPRPVPGEPWKLGLPRYVFSAYLTKNHAAGGRVVPLKQAEHGQAGGFDIACERCREGRRVIALVAEVRSAVRFWRRGLFYIVLRIWGP